MALHPKKGSKNRVTFVFEDEAGYSERPFVVSTWAPKGRTPLIRSAGHWHTCTAIGMIACTPSGKHPRFFLRLKRQPAKAADFVATLKHLRRHIRGRVFLFWDRLGGHKAKIVQAHINANRSWLTVFHFPAYAPELNPQEYVWSASKKKDTANYCAENAPALHARVRRSATRLRNNPDLLKGCLKRSGLFS